MKKASKRKQKLIIRTAAWVMAGFLAGSCNLAAFAAGQGAGEGQAVVDTKEEVVYSLLGQNGAVEELYVVNILNVQKGGHITDNGSYEEVKNLTNTEALTQKGGLIEAAAEPGRFYYQGTMKKRELPWQIQIDYFLDGRKIKPEQLGGEKGHLEMQVRTEKNETLDSIFFENYMLQVTVTLNSDSCSNIVGEGGTFANAGSNKIITFTVMPNTEGRINVEADIEDFEMEGISFAAVPFSMDSFAVDLDGLDEMTDGFTALADAVTQLNSGVLKLRGGSSELSKGVAATTDAAVLLAGGMNTVYGGSSQLASGARQTADGTKELSDGAKKIAGGSKEFKSGIQQLSKNSYEMTAGSAEIYNALKYINTTLSGGSAGLDLTELTALPEGLRQMAGGLNEAAGGLAGLAEGYSAGYQALDGAIQGIPDNQGYVTEETIEQLYRAANGNQQLIGALHELTANYQAAQTVKGTYQHIAPAFQAADEQLPLLASSITAISTALNTTAGQIETALLGADMDGSLTQLTMGLNELTKSYGQFHEGLKSYTNGVNELAGGYEQLDAGMQGIADGTGGLAGGAGQIADGTGSLSAGLKELADGGQKLAGGSKQLAGGAGSLADGVAELYQGTERLDTETKDMPDAVEAAIEELMGDYDTSDFKPVSFVAAGQAEVAAVQFVIQSAAIEKPEAEAIMEETAQKETIWTRFLDLFKR